MRHDLPYNPEYPNLLCIRCGKRRDAPTCSRDVEPACDLISELADHYVKEVQQFGEAVSEVQASFIYHHDEMDLKFRVIVCADVKPVFVQRSPENTAEGMGD